MHITRSTPCTWCLAPCRASAYVCIVHADGPCGASITNNLVRAQGGLQLNWTWKWAQFTPGLWRLSTTCFFLLHFLSFSCLLGLFCTLTLLLSLSQCHQQSPAFSTQHVRCGGLATLSSTSSIVKKRCSSLARHACPRPPSSVHMTQEFLSVHMSANKCKLTFLSVTDTYVPTFIARIDLSFKASR